MCKALVIVESPVKAKTINKYLGDKYIVKSSIGHVRDLAESSDFSAQKNTDIINKIKKNEYEIIINKMGVDPFHGWQANYQILPSKEKIVAELKLLASKAKHIYLATDLDREGEAIAWHLREIIGGNNQLFSRVIFNEITKNTIQQAFANPGELNINRVNAQQARRFLDRIVGYMISPLLWKKIAHGLSAGRVQSVAVRLIVERERKIKAFIPQEYWQLHAQLLDLNGVLINMEVTHKEGKPFKPTSKVQIDSAIEILNKACYQVLNRKDKLIISKPNPPFITSTLQQAASKHFGFSIKRTMMMAQLLYELGYITYMRTDSTNLSKNALIMAHNYIENNFGKKYLPKQVNIYTSKRKSQEAHEAIRPSNVRINVNSLIGIEEDAKKLYQLIWQQFIACQMTSAEFNLTILTVKADNFELKSKNRTLRFDGWTKVMSISKTYDKDKLLSMMKVTNQLKLEKLSASKHFTKPPARFNEASLVRELERLGIGRPSTYPMIISTIQDRRYVKIKNSRFYAGKIAEIVTDWLIKNFNELIDYNFTARMEDQLDSISENRINWKKVLDNFFVAFIKKLENINNASEKECILPKDKIVLTSFKCPECYQQMGIKTTTTGVFLSCSGYNLALKKYCKKTINLIPEYELSDALIREENSEINSLLTRHKCSKCGIAMDSYFIDNKYKLYICSNNPICSGYELKEDKFDIKGYNCSIIKCNKCNSEMHFKIGRFGKYVKCINDACKNTQKILNNGEIVSPKVDPIHFPELVCKKSNAYFVLRDGVSGIFLAANTFPKSRETRAPLVEELVRFKDRLPIKFRYLTLAPLIDPKGNKTIIKFNRKTKQQYICSKYNGKFTGWNAFYSDGKWVEKNK